MMAASFTCEWATARTRSPFNCSTGARPEVSGGNCLTFSKASQVAVLHQTLSERLCARTGGHGTWVEIGRRFGLAR